MHSSRSRRTGGGGVLRSPIASGLAVGLLLAGLAVWYAANLPGSFHADETLYAQSGLALLRGNPYAAPARALAPTGTYFVGLGQVLFGPTTVAARAFAVCFGLAAVYLTYRLGRRLRGPTVGFVAAFLLGTSYPFASQSVVAMVDVPLACFVVGLTAVTLRWSRTRNRAWLPFVGVLVAAAATTKAYGLLYVLPHVCFVAVVLARRYGLRSTPARSAPFVGGALATAAVVYLPLVVFPHPPAPPAYAASVPFAATALELPVVGNFAYALGGALATDSVHVGSRVATVAGTASRRPPAWSYLYWLLAAGGSLAFGAFALAVVAAVRRAFVRRDAEWALLAGSLAVPFVALSLLAVKFPRYVLPLYPLVFAVAVAVATDGLAAVRRLLSRNGVRISRPQARLAVVALLVLALLAPPSAALRTATEPVGTDTGYDRAAAYVDDYAATNPEETVTVVAYGEATRIPFAYYLDAEERVEIHSLRPNGDASDETYAEYRRKVENGEVDVVVGRAEDPRVDDEFRRTVADNGERVLSVRQTPDGTRLELYLLAD